MQLEARKIASKNAGYKKITKEDFHNEISHMFQAIAEEILKRNSKCKLSFKNNLFNAPKRIYKMKKAGKKLSHN